MKKVLLFANTDWYLYNFRLALCRALRDQDFEVTLVCPPGEFVSKLKAEGFRVVSFPFDIGGMGVVSNLGIILKVFRLYRREKPDIVHHFTIKCVMSGGIAARLLGIPRISAVTGLGHLFIHQSLKMKLVRFVARFLYRFVCGGKASHAVFQNDEDRSLFVEQGMVSQKRSSVIRGSGVNCDLFSPDSSPRENGPCRVLFVGRLIREKGIYELLQAARELISEGVDFELLLAGERYSGNPSSLTESEVKKIKEDGVAVVLGHVKDMNPLLHRADIVVLPSYSEGTPKSLLEAAACGKPLVATDVAGCRGLVIQDVNGELIEPRNAESLKWALQKLIHDPTLRMNYGLESRRIIVERFSDEIVVNSTIKTYFSLMEAKQF